jgi:hypothetical protein
MYIERGHKQASCPQYGAKAGKNTQSSTMGGACAAVKKSPEVHP